MIQKRKIYFPRAIKPALPPILRLTINGRYSYITPIKIGFPRGTENHVILPIPCFVARDAIRLVHLQYLLPLQIVFGARNGFLVASCLPHSYFLIMLNEINIAGAFRPSERAVVFNGSCLDFLRQIPDESLQLIVTSPPYNLGKEYEKRQKLESYVELQTRVIRECVRALANTGSICWQVGNHVVNGAIVPLDSLLYPIFAGLGLMMRNRIIWHFEHGLHCTNRFSGRYETVVWFTKTDDYTFNLDPVRIPQKYPGKKYFKGPRAGQYSCNPLGKNPGDLWVIPNVKNNHVEKTIHPCQFPVELVERLILSMTNQGDWVFDPFLGVGTTIVAAIRHGRRGAGAEIESKYVEVARDRITQESRGTLPTRPMGKPVYDPERAGNSLRLSPFTQKQDNDVVQLSLIEPRNKRRYAL